jgi:chemotaxis protein histidine kinase CheA
MYGICESILAINPSAQVTVNAEDLDQIIWLNGTAVISKSNIQAKQAELKTAYDAKEYQRKRAEEYPSMADQLDDIYHNGVAGWKTTIKVTKDKYPKG